MAKRKRKTTLPTKGGKKRRKSYLFKKGYSGSSGAMKRGKRGKKRGGGVPGNPHIYTKMKFLTQLWVGSAATGVLIGWLAKANLPGSTLAPKSGAGKEIGLALVGITAGMIVGNKSPRARKWLAIGTSSALSIAGYKIAQSRNDLPGAIVSLNNMLGAVSETKAPGGTATPAATPTATPTATPAPVTGRPSPVMGYSVQGNFPDNNPTGTHNPAEVNVGRELRWGT